jgi:hypothetical protein
VNLVKINNLERIDKMGKQTKRSKVKKYSFGDLGKTIYAYFDKKGIENVNYEESLKIAKKCCPHTKYQKSHFAWYKSHYRKFILPLKK